MNFTSLGLSDLVCNHLKQVGFEKPTAIQEMAIPKVIANADLMASAQTGTGKTGSFLIPLIDWLIASRTKNRLPRLLILEPTRELALQVYEQFYKFSPKKLTAALLVGGESNILQERTLQKGVDVIIATPGRFLDLLDKSKIMMINIKTLVIDEADRMLDMGFIPDIDRITGLLQDYRQTLLFSATFNPEIEALGNRYLVNPKRISTETVNGAATTIDQFLCISKNKRAALEDILKRHENQQAIIFCNQKREIIKLVDFLKKKKFNAIDLHGDLTQDQRTQRLEDFKNESYQLLIASDVAARGIDIADLGLVINYDAPIQAQDYVHRIGRTGRAGNKGIAYLIADSLQDKKVKSIQSLIQENIQVVELEHEAPAIKEKKVKKTKDDVVLDKNRRMKKEPFFEKELPLLENVVGFGDFLPAFILKTPPVFE
ncbi:MAG: ATP-dependent RNA helicase RhlE [Holosporales bacterium]